RSLYNENRLIKTIEKGTKLITNISEDEFIPRSIILNQLKEILQPTKYHSSYHMICVFWMTFGEALNFAFEEDITLTRQLIRKIGGGTTNDESNIYMLTGIQVGVSRCNAKIQKGVIDADSSLRELFHIDAADHLVSLASKYILLELGSP
ncbi:1353_t:CDS:2, partial [Funneliformis caledonium]